MSLFSIASQIIRANCKFLFVFAPLSIFSLSWSTPATINTSANTQTVLITTCYDSQNNRIFAAFPAVSGLPQYAIYSNGSWGSTANFNGRSVTSNYISLCYDSTNDRVFAAWIDSNTQFPIFSIYSGGSWSSAIPISTDFLGNSTVSLSYDSTNDRVFALWAQAPPSLQLSLYSIYSGGSWQEPAFIDTILLVKNDIFTSYNSTSDQVFATWADADTSAPVYTIYDGSMNSWSPASVIDAVNLAIQDVFLTYNSANNTVLATWGSSSSGSPFYAIYSGGSWGSSASFGTGTSVASNVCTSYNTTDQTFTAVWSNASQSDNPTYSIFSGGSWGSAQRIDTSSSQPASAGPFVSYDSALNATIATWLNTSSLNPYYSFYPSTNVLNPPTGLSGKQKVNNFGIAKEFYNALSWTASISTEVVSYQIYRDGALIATVGNSTLSFEDHDQPKNTPTAYSIYSINQQNERSTAATITVN